VVVIGEVLREVFIFVGERVVHGLDALRKEKKSYGQGTTAAEEIRKRQGSRRARARGEL
jgi:hypothetical protein